MMHNPRLIHFPALVVAFILASPALQAQGSSVDEAPKAQIDEARAQYDRGLEAMEAEKYSEALEYFKQSYATVSSPNSQLMVGRVLVKLGRLTEAYAELRHAHQHATDLAASQKKYQKTMESAQQDLDAIKNKLSFVMVRQGATAKIEGRPVGPFSEDEPVAVMPGAVKIEMTYADGTTQTKQFLLSPGEKADLPQKRPSPTPKTDDDDKPAPATDTCDGGDLGMSRKTLGYVVGGVGVVGVATFVGIGVLGASVFGDPSENCTNGQCTEAAFANRGRKSMLQGIGYSGLGMGVIGLGLGAWLVLGGDDKAKPATALRMGPGMVQVTRTF